MNAMMDDTASLASFTTTGSGDEDGHFETDEHDDISNISLTMTSPTHPNRNRVSMEEYYDHHHNRTPSQSLRPTDPLESPPSYDASTRPPSLRRAYSIQPREDEGREQLPGYSSAISLEGIFSKKMELEGAIHKAADRNWGRIFVTLQGTALSFYTFKASSVLAKHQLAQKTPDLPAGTKRGVLIRTYNLQHADVGIAADYLKRPYVIRVRAEADQFLLSCKRIETFVQWLQSLCAAIDLAPPLDEREIPRDHSVPRTGRYRRRPAVNRVQPVAGTTATPSETIPEDVAEASSASTPVSRSESSITLNVESITTITSTTTTTTSSSSSTHVPESSTTTSAVLESLNITTSHRPNPHHIQNQNQNQHSLPSSHGPNPSVSPLDGKWRPIHKWGPMYDMMYARRCMAILTHKSPRKSNMVIMKGKMWVVDWGTGTVTRWGPPEYGEVCG